MKDILIKLRELLTPADAWIKQDFARRGDGTATSGRDPDAVCFCLLGGLDRVTPNDGAYKMARELFAKLTDVPVTMFNDDPNTTHQDVLALIDRAITA